MKCEICNVNSATIKLVEIINGEKFKIHLCLDCAEKKGLTNPAANLPKLLEDAISKLESRKSRKSLYLEKKKPRCPFCMTTISDLRKTGKLGCRHCYSIFWSEIATILNNYQGLTSADLPTISESDEEKIKRLEKELKKSVKLEDYEKAAEIRDKISGLIDTCN